MTILIILAPVESSYAPADADTRPPFQGVPDGPVTLPVCPNFLQGSLSLGHVGDDPISGLRPPVGIFLTGRSTSSRHPVHRCRLSTSIVCHLFYYGWMQLPDKVVRIHLIFFLFRSPSPCGSCGSCVVGWWPCPWTLTRHFQILGSFSKHSWFSPCYFSTHFPYKRDH